MLGRHYTVSVFHGRSLIAELEREAKALRSRISAAGNLNIRRAGARDTWGMNLATRLIVIACAELFRACRDGFLIRANRVRGIISYVVRVFVSVFDTGVFYVGDFLFDGCFAA